MATYSDRDAVVRAASADPNKLIDSVARVSNQADLNIIEGAVVVKPNNQEEINTWVSLLTRLRAAEFEDTNPVLIAMIDRLEDLNR